ncbi:MAG: glycerophosphodiester phosphodiesterase family protein [Paracoccaceae bacterium]
MPQSSPPRVALPPGFLRLPIAHRALHDRARGRVENSAAAFAAAIAAGYPIETDLQLSSDGVAMVFHDHGLKRLTDQSGPVSARTAAELGRIRLKDSSDTIPTLTQILAQVAGRVPLLIELKDQTRTMTATDGRLELATAQALAAYTGDVAVMSFNPACIYHMARLAPTIPRGLITAAYDTPSWRPLTEPVCAHFRTIPDYDPTGSSFISHEAADLARPRVAQLKSQGAAILCWTITSPAEDAAARQIADNVTFEGYLPPLPA